MTTNTLFQTIKKFEKGIKNISSERKEKLDALSKLMESHDKVQFICTHNSRRSIFAQVWSWVASLHYQVPVASFSGGTETTSVYKTVIKTLKNDGLVITDDDESKNPQFSVFFSDEFAPINIYSKVFDSEENPTQDFLAVMTCSQADENCPFIPGAKARFSLTYEDPKFSDQTKEEQTIYAQKSIEIGTEMFYIFSQLKTKLS